MIAFIDTEVNPQTKIRCLCVKMRYGVWTQYHQFRPEVYFFEG